MTYEHTVAGTLISRPGRLIAHMKTGNKTVVYYVENTRRCRELLILGATAILEFHPDAVLSGRKTEHDLIGVYGNGLPINMDPQAPNKTTWERLASLGGNRYMERNHYPLGSYIPFDVRWEATHGSSRFDLAFSPRNRDAKVVSLAFMEVKGVAPGESGLALSPDAPAKRGIKRLKGLTGAHEKGYETYILFVIQMRGILGLTPNDTTHPTFGETLRQAREAGVYVLAYNCLINLDTMTVGSLVKVVPN